MEHRLSDHDEDTLAHAPQIEPEPLSDLTMVVLMLLMESREDIDSILDLAAGDGRLLATFPEDIPTWGYDSNPANIAMADSEHGVEVRQWDPISNGIVWADLTIAAECLERLPDPHAMVRRISRHSRFIVASSPVTQEIEDADPGHLWAWDMPGYEAIFRAARYRTVRHVWDITSNRQTFVGERE